MRDEIERSGSRLLIANLWTMPYARAEWQRFFASRQFEVADCVVPQMPGVHPDVFWNLHHADCIEQAMRRHGPEAN
jgi:hypothetical protein